MGNDYAILGEPSVKNVAVGGKVRLLRDSKVDDDDGIERAVPAGAVGVIWLVEHLPAPQGQTVHVDFDGLWLVLDESDRNDWQTIDEESSQ